MARGRPPSRVQAASWSLASRRSRSSEARITLTGRFSRFARTPCGATCEGSRRPFKASQHSPESTLAQPAAQGWSCHHAPNLPDSRRRSHPVRSSSRVRRTRTAQANRDAESSEILRETSSSHVSDSACIPAAPQSGCVQHENPAVRACPPVAIAGASRSVELRQASEPGSHFGCPLGGTPPVARGRLAIHS